MYPSIGLKQFGFLALLCLPGPLLAQTQTYTVTELTTPTGGYVQGANNRHEFVGSTLTTPASAILWASPSTPATLTPLSGSNGAVAYAINDSGQVVGFSAPDPQHPRATLWQGNTVTDLGILAGYRGSAAYAVNSAGVAAGYGVSQTAVDIEGNSISHAFLFSGGTVTDLGTLGGSSSGANGINSAGQIVGWSNIPSNTNPPTHATLWSSGSATDLGTLGGSNSDAIAINDAGVIVGEADLAGMNAANLPVTHAVMWKEGVAVDLGVLGSGTQSAAYAVNSSDDAVGLSDTLPNNEDPQDVQHAVLWTKGQVIDLNSALPAALQTEVVLEYAQTIADDGSIIAEARNQSTENCCSRVFLLTPVAPLAVSCPSSAAQTATAYSSAAVASGGVPPYVYAISGSLPPGLVLSSSSGAITGTPTAPGTFEFTVQATGSASGAAATHACTIIVVARPDFSLHASPSSLNLRPGSSGSVVISLTPSSGFGGVVALSVSRTPAGARFSLSPASIRGAQSATLNVDSGSASAGTYPITITGTSRSLTHVASVNLTIIGRPELTVSPASLSYDGVHHYALEAKELEITNRGSASASIGVPSVQGSGEARHLFIPISACGRWLAPAHSCRMVVILFAGHLGRLSATLEIPIKAASPLMVPLEADVIPLEW